MSKYKQIIPQNLSDPRTVSKDANSNTFLASMCSSILPPPDEIACYEKYCPGITQKLIDTYAKQVDHRIMLEKTVILSKENRATRGQVLAFILGLTIIIGGFVLIAIGKNGYGIAAIIGAVATLITSFYGGIFLQKKNLNEKEARNP